MVEAYPLQWPPAWSRIPEHNRERARFRQKTWKDRYAKPVTFKVATNQLYQELERLCARNVVLSNFVPALILCSFLTIQILKKIING